MPSTVCRLTPPIYHSIGNATPIHSLPTELLLAVFTLIDEDDERGPYSIVSMKDKRWRLGRVCHWWREVVEGSPSLWTYLGVRLAEASGLRDPAALLRHALDMTKGQPFTFATNLKMEGTDAEDDAATAPTFTARDLLDIFVAHAPCWERVVLNFCDITCRNMLSRAFGSITFSKLKFLSIMDDKKPGDHSENDGDWFIDAPLLERIVLVMTPLTCCSVHPQLKQLTLDRLTYNISLGSMLQTSSRLEVLSAYAFTAPTPVGNSETDVAIQIPPRVRSSSLRALALNRFVEHLDTVDLPKLCTLIVGAYHLPFGTPYLRSIFDLVRFSRPPLTRLALLNPDLASGNLVHILEQLPLLKLFRIHFADVRLDDRFNGNVDRALSLLTSALGDVDKETGAFTLVPDLRRLRIDFYDRKNVASAFEWTFYTPKVKDDFEARQKRNGFKASCTFKGEPWFGVRLLGHFTQWHKVRLV